MNLKRNKIYCSIFTFLLSSLMLQNAYAYFISNPQSYSPPKPFRQTAHIIGSPASSGGIPGNYYYNQNCASGFQGYSLSSGSNSITVPYTGNYVISSWVSAYNNNGGSVEWNVIDFQVVKTNSSGNASTLSDNSVGQDGGGCDDDCYQYNHGYNWWWTMPTTALNAGDQISFQGAVTQSGTHCSGNSVLIQDGGLSVNLVP